MKKFCPSCKTKKLFEEFHKCENSSSGRSWRCKECAKKAYISKKAEKRGIIDT